MRKGLNYIVNHVFLPPKLPQKNDSDVTKSISLIEEVLAALNLFQTHIPEQERLIWTPCIKMVANMLKLRDHSGALEAEKVETMLREMITGDILALHIHAQNAGLIVRRSSDQYSFESFEISPTTEAVMGTRGRLRRCFPGPAVVISQDRIANASFLEPLVELLVKLDSETPEEAWPIVTKAHSRVSETRDTVHPSFVTEMLTGILRAVGQPLDVRRIYKHTRDDVLWKNTLEPWRRSPLWLFVRVALQTSLPCNDDEDAHVRYKSYMLFLMTCILQGALEASLASDILFVMTAKISRRALKLGRRDGTPWLEYIETTMRAVQQEQNRRWDLSPHLAVQLKLAGPGCVDDVEMWPRLSTTSLLEYLAAGKISSLHNDWKASLVDYGLSISRLQRAERLLMCIGNNLDLLSELSNPGHQDWDPMFYPDWLLLEIESNILIRPVQAQIAKEMISPSSGANSILQLNMGEGKSAVIVPIVAAALADRKKLVRVVVLKPLSTQMFQLLLKKLGGMLGRRIFHMPVSRSVRLDEHKARQIHNLCEECMQSGGILLVQPEHLLSFELMGLERILSGESELGNILTETQRWLEDHSRDILDESDEILSVRFELIYTMGAQREIEFGPDRWIIIERVLGLVSRFPDAVFQKFPHGLELGTVNAQSFPRIRILQSSAAEELLQMLAKEVCEAGLPGVPVWNLPPKVRAALSRFLTDLEVSEADTEVLQRHVFVVDSMRRGLLLLRGLIAGGVLAFSLQQKRWRVNYGLDPSRTMLAVPYRAKDMPATRAEFSHPDATIVLSCLSYYYRGLSDEQLYTAFEKLLGCDQAQEEYERWLQDAPELPSAFRQLTGINLTDPAQCSQLVFPSLRLAKGAIDFYMSQIVFPKEMKEFPHKLSSSGWDIARAKIHPTTGFSGTNDSRYMLPLSICQCDLLPQAHTSAAVLDCLLRPENSFKNATEESGPEILDAELLLQIVIRSQPPVRVILDVGAQVLEWNNEEVARRWLSCVPASEAQAAVFFDDSNDLSVLSRDGITESLMISPFAKQMDQCLVYLDEAHTRGTDLKLPANYRAAVTLGPDLTKDRLVQACMRMRKLGKGQSVMFCGPMEVARKIRHCSGKSLRDPIEVADVLQWSISETCISTKKCIPLWATQGIRHQRRCIAESKSANDGGKGTALDVAKSLLEAEAQSLQDRYGFGRPRVEERVLLHGIKEESLSERETQLEAIRTKCREFELVSFNNATLREEQERELSPESEQERQVERPLPLEPCSHSVHRDVKRFIQHGILDRRSDAFQSAFELFAKTSAVECLERKTWPADLLITSDFARTVHASHDQLLDSYLRPVHWVASSKTRGVVDCVVLSPYEAQELLPSIRQHKNVTLHVYSPRVSMSVRTLEDLSFCAIPALPERWLRPSPLVTQLNLFAGQLYLKSHEDYLSVCRFLGLCFRSPGERVQVASDGFVDPMSRPQFDIVMEKECPFAASPMGFLRILMAMRRKGQSFEKSHVGRMLHGELLAEDQFQG